MVIIFEKNTLMGESLNYKIVTGLDQEFKHCSADKVTETEKNID